MNTEARPLYARHENGDSGRLGRMDNSRYSFPRRMGKSDGSRCDGRFVTCIFAQDTLSRGLIAEDGKENGVVCG